MAFRRFRGRSRFSGRRMRRKSPYEMQQLNICRFGMQTGLSDCTNPDQFLTPLISGRKEWAGQSSGAFVGPPLVAKGVVVRGMKFRFQYTSVPSVVATELQAAGVTSIRTGLVLLPLADGSLDTPAYLPTNILFNSQADTAGFFGTESLRSRVRIVWRDMQMMNTPLLPTGSSVTTVAAFTTPHFGHGANDLEVVRTAIRIDDSHGLFWLTEIVNPFLEENPLIVCDMFGVAAVRPINRGNSYV